MSAYVLALLSALSFAIGTVFQQKGTFETSAGEGDPHFLLEIIRKPVWLLGGSLQVLGWVIQAVALDRGSLVVVQSICALSLVFALPFGREFTGQVITRRTIIGALMTLVGIIAFLILGQPQAGTTQPSSESWLITLLVFLLMIIVLTWFANRRRGPASAALFATAAGICFGFQAAVTKVFVTQIGYGLVVILTSLTTYALILTAVAGFGLLQSALKTGFLAPAMAASNATSLATSVLLGVTLFQETLARDQGHLPPALIALVIAILGVITLALPETQSVKSRIG